MTKQQDDIDRALELAAKGSSKDGIQLLWPLIRDEASRDEALFALAYCFEKDENFSTASYLYDRIVTSHPDFEVAAKRLEDCRAEVRERGLTEDYEDAGHAPCPCGAFRQRAEYGACPYCGLRPGQTAADLERKAASEAVEVEELVDEPGPAEQLRDAGRAMVERVREWSGSEEMKPAKERFEQLKEDVKGKLKEFSEREGVKKATEKAEEVALEVKQRAKKIADSEAGSKAREMSHEVSERVKEVAEQPEIQATKTNIERWGQDLVSRATEWVQTERVRNVAKRTYDAIEGFLAKIQAVIDRTKK